MRAGKKISLLLFGIVLTILFTMTVFAASGKAPGKVKNLRTEGKMKKVSLEWDRVEDATGYYVYIRAPKSKTWEKALWIKKGSVTSCTIKKLKNYTTYYFRVSAYRKVNGKRYEGKPSKKKEGTPVIPKPKAPEVRTAVRKTKVTFTWKKVKDATGYEVFQKVGSKYKLVASVTGTSATVKGLTNKVQYQFKIRAYRVYDGHRANGEFARFKLTALSLKQQVESLTTSVTYKAVVNQTVKLKRLDRKGKETVESGTIVGYTTDSGGLVLLLPDGTRVRGNWNVISGLGNLYVHHEPYSADTVEYYVNKVAHVTSKTNWMLWINFYTQYVYIFKRKNSHSDWEIYGIWPTATGLINSQTPRGNQEIVAKNPRFVFHKGGGAYGLWASFINGGGNYGNAIHSPRRNPDGSLMDPPGTIGFPLSAGCVRLFDPQAKFVYDNCPIGTRLYIY